jgi:hypothetical protein
MCSCSGSCNCNSTTIPRGPQGIPGTPGATGPASTVPGPPGEDGIDGINGLNAFTTLTDDFVQPAVNATVTIHVVDATWVAVDSIIFVESSSTTDAGGYYQVVFASNLPTPTIVIKNLGWTIPSTVFVSPGSAVGQVGTLVVAAGTIGATGPQGPAGAAIIDAQWGTLGSTVGGSNALKTSILVPANTLSVDDDVLECQTIFIVDSPILSAVRSFIIKVCPTTSTTGTTAIQFEIPVSAPAETITTIHLNYKIQRFPGQLLTPTKFRSKGECFVSDYGTSATLYIETVLYSYLCTSTAVLTLDGSSNWSNDQYITVIVNDETTPVIYVAHHEVKVVKK